MSEKINELRFNSEKAMNYFAKNLAYTLGPVELKEMMDKHKIKLIDVREKEDYEISHLPNAVNIPYADLKDSLEFLSTEEINVIYCYNYLCHLGDRAAFRLAEAGYPVMLMQGGFEAWTEDFHFAVTQ